MAVLLATSTQADVVLDDANGNPDYANAIPASDIVSITIDPQFGDIIIRTNGQYVFAPSGGGGEPPAGPVPSVSLGVNTRSSISVDTGTSVTMSWSVSDADSCSTSGGNTAWRSTSVSVAGNGTANSSANIVVDFTGSRNFYLGCANTNGSAQDYVTVTGVDPGPTDPPPDSSGTCGNNVTVVDWSELDFKAGSGFDFPAPTGSVTLLQQSDSATLSIRFNTATASAVGGWVEFHKLSEGMVASISSCKGDFKVDSACKVKAAGTSSNLYWQTDGSVGSNFCDLVKGSTGATYYLNLRYPNGCGASVCKALLYSRY